MTRRHIISLTDLTDADLRSIVRRGAGFAAGPPVPQDGVPPVAARTALAGTVTGIFFRRTSTRTRTAFSAAAQRLSGGIVTFRPEELQLATGETSADTMAVFARMLDILVARTADDEAELREWAAQDRMSVINAMSAREHPTQGLADLTTCYRHFGRVSGLRVLYVGEGNSTAAALALGLTRFPRTHLHVAAPPGYGLPPEIAERAAKQAAASGAALTESHDLAQVPERMDAIYTARWQTTGSSKADPDWRAAFAPFQVTSALWQGSPDAVFMHDLPAHRGEEVSAEVLDGPRSIAFDQAENKMWSAMAALEWCARGALDAGGQL